MKRVLPADVYDTLEFSALVYGGIGRDLYWDYNDTPCCIHGHAMMAAGSASWINSLNPIVIALRDAGIHEKLNDRAVGDDRISFRTWCRRLNVVRGA